jgi:hypothetical protein
MAIAPSKKRACTMKKNRRVRKRRSWETADHKFAVATMILFAFFLAAGIAGWLTRERPTVAAEPSTAMRSGAQ